MKNVERCPFCGEQEFIEGRLSGHAWIVPAKKIFTLQAQDLYHIICVNCGAVVKTYVKNPKELITK